MIFLIQVKTIITQHLEVTMGNLKVRMIAKANELVEYYLGLNSVNNLDDAKKSAILYCDNFMRELDNEFIWFWDGVKTEIENYESNKK